MAGNMLMINVGVNSKDAENSLASLEETLKNISKKDADLKVGENLATEVENARKKYLDMVKMVNSTEGELQKAFAISGLKQTIADIEALNKKISETGAKIKPIELQSVMFDGKELFDIKGIDKSLNKFAKKLDKESNDAFANILTTNLGQQFFSKQKIELEKQLETDLKNLAKDFSQDKLEQYINKYLKIRSIDVAKNGKDKIATSGVTPKAITDLIDNKTISKQLAEGKIDVKAMFQKKATDVGFVKNMKDQIFSELMAFLNQNTDANTFGTKYTDAQMTEMTQRAKESKKQIKLLKEEFIGLINQYNGFNRNSKIELVLDTVARIESLRKELKGLGQDISEINNIEKQDEYKENLNTLKYTLIPDGNDDYYDEDFDTYLLKLKNDFNKLNNTNIQSIMSMNIGDEKKIEKLKENLTQIDELLIKTNSYDSIVPNVSSEVIGDIEILKKQRGQIIAGLKQLNVDVAGVGIPMADYIAGGNKGSGGSGSGTGSGDGDGNGIGSGTGNGGGMTPEEMEKLKKDYADLTAEVEKYKVQIAETTAKLEEMKKTQAESEGDKSKIKELQASLDALNVSYAEAARKKAEAEKEAVKAAEEAENKMSVAEKSREEQKRKALERQAVQSGTQNIVSSDNSADTSPADNTTLSAILTEVKSINGKMDKPAKVEIANNSPETFTDGDQSKLVTTSLSNVDPTKAEVIIKALGTLSKALKDYETVNKSIELPKINGDTAQIDSIIPKMNELTKSLKEFKATVTGIANSSVIGGLDNLIEKLRNLSTSGKIDLQISNVKSVNEEIDKFSKMVIEWAEAIQIQKKAGANEVERVALFNSKNGFLSNSYVSDKNTEVRDAVNREMLKRYQKEKVDTHIHSHPENIAAFSFDDLNNHIKRLEYGITKNLVVASKEVMKIDLSGVTDKNEYTQFISELQQKIISQMNDFLYNQLKDISANKIANQTSVKYWAKQISNRAIPKSGISINDEILSDIDAKLYDYFNNFINSLHPTNTKSTSLYEGLMETYDNTINELTANGKNSELLKYKDRLYNAISKEILQTFRTQSGIVSEDEYATAQKKFLLDGFRDSKYANVLSVMSIEDFKKNNPALSQITQSQENQSSDNTKLDEIIRELKNISQKMDTSTTKASNNASPNISANQSPNNIPSNVTTPSISTEVQAASEASTAEVQAFTTIDDAVKSLTGDINAKTDAIKAEAAEMIKAAESEIAAIEKIDNAIVQAKTPNEKLTKKKKDTEYKTETIMPSDTNQPTTQSEVKPEETTQEIYKETEAYKTLSQTLQECDQNFQKIISQDDASEKQFNDKKRQLFSLIGIIKKVMDQCYELGDQNAHFDDLIEYGESLRRKAIEASCDLNEQKAVVEAAHRKVEEEKKATEATNQKANSEISVVDKKIQKQKNNTLSDNLENTPVEIKNNIDKAIEVNKFKANPDGIDELRKSISSQLKNVKIQSFDATTAAESVKETLSKVLDGVGLKFDTEKLGNEVREAVSSGVEAASAEQKPETSDNKAVRFKEKATNDIGKLRDKYADKLQGQQLEVFKERLNEIDNKIKEIKDDASNYTDENAQVIDKDIKQIESLVNSFKEINNSEDKINSLIQKLKDSKNNIEHRGAVAQPVVNNINSEMSALEELKRSGQNLNVGNPAEVQAFIDKLHEADATVASLQQSAKDIRISTNATASVAKLDSKFNDLLFKVDKFRRDNSKITSDKGISAQFDSLMRSIQTIEKSDVNFQRLKAQFDQLKATVQGKGLTGRSLGDELKYIAEKIGIKAMLGNSIYRVIGAFRQMVGIVTELDTGMTTLRRVTEETEATYKKFLKTAGDEAHELGSTVSGLVDSTGDFARLGYNIQEANALAKNAVMYSNVGWLDIQTATADMTSTMKAFNIEASDSIRIVDTFDILGKKLPLVTISVKGWRHSRPSKDIVNHNICVTTAGGVW